MAQNKHSLLRREEQNSKDGCGARLKPRRANIKSRHYMYGIEGQLCYHISFSGPVLSFTRGFVICSTYGLSLEGAPQGLLFFRQTSHVVVIPG